MLIQPTLLSRGEGGVKEVTMERKKLEETILKKAKGGKLPCAMCFKIAEKFKISKREMGKILECDEGQNQPVSVGLF